MARRTVRFFDVRIRSSARIKVNDQFESVPVATRHLLEILKEIELIYSGATPVCKVLPSEIKYYLAGIEIDEQQSKAVLLVNKSDPTEPDQTISNPLEKLRDSLAKPEGYGNDYSAHICFSLNPTQPNLYSMVYESPRGGVSGSQIHSFLNYLLREARSANEESYKVPHPSLVIKDGAQVMVNALHAVDLNGKISDDFFNDLQNGELGRIELLNYDDAGEYWDQTKGFKEDRKVLVLRPEITVLEQKGVLAVIRDTFRKGRDTNYKEAVVVFKDESGLQHSVNLFTDDMTLVDNERYVKKVSIEVPDAGLNGFEVIDNDIKQALYKLV